MDGRDYPSEFKHSILSVGSQWKVDFVTSSSITLKLRYEAGTPVKGEDGQSTVIYPRSFEATRIIAIDEKGGVMDELIVRSLSDKPMPFAGGFHPAYKAPKGSVVQFSQGGQRISVKPEEVHAEPGQVKLFENVGREISYITPTYTLNFTTTENLNVLWLWNKFADCLAIESLSASVQRKDVPLDQMPGYENQIAPGETRAYRRYLRIEPHPPLILLV
jgi:hypothetical protein